MTKKSPIEELVELIGAVRRRVAPPESARERWLRSLYVPLLLRLETRALSRVEPNPYCETLTGEAVLGARLPAAPRILVLKLDHIGDFIVAMPAMQHLRDHFPAAHITLVCGSWTQDWARQIGLFDRVVVFDGMKRSGPAWTGFSPAVQQSFTELRLGGFDLAIDLRHDPDTRVLLGQVDAIHRAGFCAPADQGGASLDLALPNVEHVSTAEGTGRPLPAEQRLLLLASAITNGFARPEHPALRLMHGGMPEMAPRRYAILAPGAGGAIRLWNEARLQAVGAFLIAQHDLDLVVIGYRAERRVAEAFSAALPAGRVRSAVGLSLAELPNLMRDAVIYVGYDTGPTHLAAALGIPTVSVMSGIPCGDVWRVLGDHVAVVRGHAACSPCHLMEVSQCPHGVVCLDVISVEDVVSACRGLLTADGRAAAPVVSGDHVPQSRAAAVPASLP